MNGENLLDFGTDILVTPPGYVDKPGEAVFTAQIASGDLLVRVPLKFREDSDFIVRSVKAAAVDAGFSGSGNLGKALGFAFRFTDSEGRYLSNMQADYQLAAGSGTLPKDLTIPIFVPSGGVLLIDVTADTDGGLARATQALIVFCGVRRFRGQA